MSKEVYTSLTESTVNTAIARLYATSANHKKNDYTHTSSLLAIVPLNTVDRVFDYSVTTQLLSHIYIGFLPRGIPKSSVRPSVTLVDWIVITQVKTLRK